MRVKRIDRAIVVALSVCWAAASIAAPQMQPARIGEHAESMANTIAFPDVPGDYTLYLRCEAKVMAHGAIDEVGCYDDADIDDAFFRAVGNGALAATVLPASVDGENTRILLLFTVLFRQQGDQRVIAVVPNHGTNAQELGMSYIAPQRYGPMTLYAPRTELGLLWVDATMKADGEPSKIDYIDTEFSNKETRRYAKRYMQDNTFIPGFVNGEPQQMRFVKPIFGYRNGFMWQKQAGKCQSSNVSCDEVSSRTGAPRFVFED